MVKVISILSFCYLFFVPICLFSKGISRDVIRSHDRVTINTDASEGIKSFSSWAVFPSRDTDVRNITMFLTLGHPDTMDIAHWDYLDFIYLRRVGGKNADSLNVEIGRMITPYGSSFKNDWSFTWEVDVTDFAMFLRDSVEIDYLHSGYEPEELGWSLTIEFDILFGPPVALPISISEVYLGKYPYGRSGDPIENHLKPYSFAFNDKAAFGRLRIQHTGHGADRPSYCSEFCSRWREVWINNDVIDRRDLWKECGANPLYPQGGTWVYDRGYWCPGELQDPDIIDIPYYQGEQVIRFKMEPYEAEENIQAEEVIGAYLIQYASPTHKHDVTIEKILVPSDNQLYSRLNPASFTPQIQFKNNGSEALRRLRISYGVAGFKKRTYTWQGLLNHGESIVISLPGEVDFKKGLNVFEVFLDAPNGKKDEWVLDNSMKSEFTSPKELPLNFLIRYKTNNHPEENLLYILDSKKDTVYHRKPESVSPNSIYSDTLSLKPGKYEFYLTDSAGDGLEFWAKPLSGYGYLRFLDFSGNILHNFISDCGSGQFLAFHATANAMLDLSDTQNAFFLYPRRTKRNIELDAWLVNESILEVRFIADGELMASHIFNQFKEGVVNFDLGMLNPGRYIVEIYVDGVLMHRNRINRDA